MKSHKELRCIDAARNAKIIYAQRRLDDFLKKNKNFENPLTDILDALNLKLNTSEKIEQLIFIPARLIILCLLTPLTYAIHLIESCNTKIRLKRELMHVKTRIENIKSPKIKTLNSLWNIYGLDQNNYTHNDRIDLLSKWITILYGKETLERLNINQIAHAIGEKNSNLNRPYFESEKNAPHYYIRPIVDILIEKLSEDLPAYELVDKNAEYKTVNFETDEKIFEIPEFLRLK